MVSSPFLAPRYTPLMPLPSGIPSPRRTGLWLEIAFNLAVLTGVAIGLSTIIVWLAADEVREGNLEVTALSAAQLAGAKLLLVSPQGMPTGEVAQQALDSLHLLDLGVDQVVVVSQGFELLARVGEGVPEEVAQRREWLLAREEVREAFASRQRAMGEEVSGRFPFQSRALGVAFPLVWQRRTQGVVRVRVPLSGPSTTLGQGAVVVLAYALVTTAVIAGFGFYQFRGLILRPLQNLRDGTARIAAGEFEVRVASQRNDELGDLSRAFNGMAEALEAYRERALSQVESLTRINDTLVRTQQELVHSEKMASVGRLAAGVAHEVGNPLAAVLGFTELLQEMDGEPEVRADLLARTQRELLRIHGIIGGLLDYARPEGEALVPVDLGAVVESALEVVGLQKRALRMQFTSDILPGTLLAVAEFQRLRQVVVNLLLNAVDATSEQGKVWVTGKGEEDRVVVRVSDDGPGVPEELRERVFDPFFTTKEPGQGTGLGLSVSAGIVESFGGHLKCVDEEGRGACFEMVLKAAPA